MKCEKCKVKSAARGLKQRWKKNVVRCIDRRSTLRWALQCRALAIAAHCVVDVVSLPCPACLPAWGSLPRPLVSIRTQTGGSWCGVEAGFSCWKGCAEWVAGIRRQPCRDRWTGLAGLLSYFALLNIVASPAWFCELDLAVRGGWPVAAALYLASAECLSASCLCSWGCAECSFSCSLSSSWCFSLSATVMCICPFFCLVKTITSRLMECLAWS